MRDHILFYLNGAEQRVGGDAVFQTVSRWLREVKRATGTKIVCEEGDCGACTVLVGRPENGAMRYRPVNSCIQFLFQLDGTHVVTVEGLAPRGELAPVQDAMIRCQGAQCGYCTPGFIMAMAAMGETGERDIKRAVTGNLCRCTGYEPMMKAAGEVDWEHCARVDELYPAGPMLEAFANREAVATPHFFQPATLEEAVRFKAANPKAVIVQGATDFGVWWTKRGFAPEAVLSLRGIDGLDELRVDDGMLIAGARVSLTDFEALIVEKVPELREVLDRFGSPQIKNAGTLAGNIANASPIADTLPFLFVMEARLELTGSSGSRLVDINHFYRGYKQLALAADEIITRILIPLPEKGDVLRTYKISKRSHLDISTFTAAFLMKSDAMRIAYGGVGPVVLRLPRTEALLAGKTLTLELIEQAGDLACEEITPISDVRGSREYRLQLAREILKKFYYETVGAAGLALPKSDGGASPAAPTAARESYVGSNVPHDSARGHVTGDSIYIDDMPPQAGELLVDFVWSPYVHARIKSIELNDARRYAHVYTYKDLHHNVFGPILKDEILLAEDETKFRGQPVVVVAAETRDALNAAKRAIKLEYEELTPILTIDDAIAASAWLDQPRVIRRGDADAALAKAEHVLEGVFNNLGQDHFYLESQAALVMPGEHGQLTVHSSTQNPTEVQEVIAHLLGLDMSQVVVITKRMGGGFGGKECQATHPAAIAALVAQQTRRPARIVYDKDMDMHVTGKRHPFQNRYRVGFTSAGEITALKVDLYSDGGAYADLSPAVMGRAMTHVDGAYFIPDVEIRGTVCMTHNPPNTAFRGFGGPQGAVTMENIIEEIAHYLKKDAIDVRRASCYGIENRNVTPYGQIVERNTLPRLFTELPERCDYAARVEAVRAFNAESKTHLKGIALTPVKFGISFNTKFLNQANALVNIYLDGSVQVSTGATEMGQGVNTKIRQLVADELGVPIERVLVMATSTEKNNNTSATAASSAADLNGSAAVDACRRIRARLADVAARELARDVDVEPSPESLVFARGFVHDERRPAKRLRWEDLVGMAYRLRVSLGERGFYATPRIDWSWTSGSGHPFLYFTMGASCSEVLIDRFTGAMKVLRSDVLMDIGRPINPGVDRGQITGAFIQGMGWLTTEELKYTEKGELLSHSPTTYKIPNINDVPEVFNVDWIDVDNPVNLYGSKAVGEPPLLMAMSVWCAVKNALSFVSNGTVPKLRVPATSEEILMRLASYSRIHA